MERIKEALERARQDQAKAPRPDKSAAVADAAGKTPGEGIRYTKTRTFPTSETVLRDKRVIADSDSGEATAAYNLLRTQVLQRMKEHGWNALAITSPGTQEGKTLTAVNLAISLAREVNYTVLLVDLDLRKPSVHGYFGYVPEKGLTDHLFGDAPLQEVLFNPGVERLVVLPGREAVANSSEVLSSPRMVKLVEELKSRYPSRIVLFDLPPLLSADDAMAFSPYVDAALLVIEDGKTDREDLERSIGFLRTTEILGTVLNKASA